MIFNFLQTLSLRKITLKTTGFFIFQKIYSVIYSIFLSKLLIIKLSIDGYGMYLLLVGTIVTISTVDLGITRIALGYGKILFDNTNSENKGKVASLIYLTPLILITLLSVLILIFLKLFNFNFTKYDIGFFVCLVIFFGSLMAMYRSVILKFLEGYAGFRSLQMSVIFELIVDVFVLISIYLIVDNAIIALYIYSAKQVLFGLYYFYLFNFEVVNLGYHSVSIKNLSGIVKDLKITSLMSLITIFSSQVDKYIIAFFMSNKDVAIYSISLMIYRGFRSLSVNGTRFIIGDKIRNQSSNNFWDFKLSILIRILITVLPLILVYFFTEQISDFFEINETLIFKKLIIIWMLVSMVWSIFSPFLLSLNYQMKYLIILKLEIFGVLINLLVTIIGLYLGALYAPALGVFFQFIFSLIFIYCQKK